MVKFTKEMKKKAIDSNKNTKPTKKAVVEVETEQQDVETTKENGVANGPAKSVENSIFQFFNGLTHEQEQTRQQAALQLLQHLGKSADTEKQQKEFAYTLKRLVRGCGAATNTSRAGFYTTLVALLKAFNEEAVPLAQVFETMQKELQVGKTIKNKEDADAIVGKVLVCGAIIYSGRAEDATNENLAEVTKTLLEATQHRTYHASLAFSLIVEMVKILPQSKFEKSVWPLLLPTLTLPWTKQTLQTVHCLLALQNKFPSVLNEKFWKKHFSQTTLINVDNYEHLYKIFWQNNNIDILMHPAFELFGLQLATSADLKAFWTNIVDAQLKTPTKLVEVVTIKIATDILQHLTGAHASNVVDILSNNFVNMLVAGLKRSKVKKDEALRAFYNEFLEALVECCVKDLNDKTLVAVIKRLVLPPGIFSIEKYTQTRILHQIIAKLGDAGIQELYDLYKQRFLVQTVETTTTKASNNMERVQAGYMLQHLLAHKSVQGAHEWRLEQLCFLWRAGIFHMNDKLQVCKEDKAGSFSKEFGEQCKNIFYASLVTKIHDLAQEQNLLLKMVLHVQQQMQELKWNKEYLRINVSNDELLANAWQRMFDKVNSKKSAKKGKGAELQQVFDILLLHMGLHLYCEPDMAVPAIDDLLKCMQRTTQQLKVKKVAKAAEGEEEPEWIEVLIDLLLHLLSQNSSTLRNIVNALFPHLCGSLNLNAVHQILSMLEMKDGYNPLSAKGEEDDDDDDDDEEEEENEEEDEEKDNDEDEENDSEEDDDDDDEDDDEEEEDDEISPSDILRNAVSQALMQNGAAEQDDDDMASIDLNDLTEEEGQRLDEALAAAFKAMKKTGTGTGNAAKKSKSFRLRTTTLMHFRIRVLDLLEIYLQHKQPQLLIVIEIMLCVFNMLEYCVGEDLVQLRTKAEKLLQKLTALKNCQTDADLQQSNLVSFMRLLVEKRVPAAIFDLINRVRNKCILFLFNQIENVEKSEVTNDILTTWQEYATDYVKSRNPTVNITLWSELFNKLRWEKVCTLADLLVQQGVNISTRIFRRIQLFEILCMFYKNQELQRLQPQLCKKTMQNIEKALMKHLQQLAENTNIKHSPKEFQTILELLLIIKRTRDRLTMDTNLQSAEIAKWVQKLRSYMRLESMQVYQQFCNAFKLTAIKNSAIASKPIVAETNGSAHEEAEDEKEKDDDEEEQEEEQEKSTNVQVNGVNGKVGKIRKRKQEVDVRKQKKQKKLLRLETSSKGLSNGLFNFASTDNDIGVDT